MSENVNNSETVVANEQAVLPDLMEPKDQPDVDAVIKDIDAELNGAMQHIAATLEQLKESLGKIERNKLIVLAQQAVMEKLKKSLKK